MRFISTRGKSPELSASEAIMQGLASDGGLYVPEFFPPLNGDALDPEISCSRRAYEVLKPFFQDDALHDDLSSICEEAFQFPVPLYRLSDSVIVLELFHGPTAAFKDFGARFLALSMERLQQTEKIPLTILVATSGDTGGAVAAAFFKRKGIQVRVLFPEEGVSLRQKQQLTCWGENVDSYAVEGSFDDCQALVKKAFQSDKIAGKYRLSSANSINLGRLLPQMVYHVHASVLFKSRTGREPVMIIPAGNLGNSVGAYWARAMGAPLGRIVLGVNENKTIPDFLERGDYRPRKSVKTLANAMDVGDPSNMERLRFLFPDFADMKANVTAYSVNDDAIRTAIRETFATYDYVLCPHTATAEYIRKTRFPEEHAILVSTAHPAKFETIVEPLIGMSVPVPPALKKILDSESRFFRISPKMKSLFPDVFG